VTVVGLRLYPRQMMMWIHQVLVTSSLGGDLIAFLFVQTTQIANLRERVARAISSRNHVSLIVLTAIVACPHDDIDGIST
jgi:hypothetical protein